MLACFCLCVRACVRTAAFSRIRARLLLAADRTERLQCMKQDSLIPSRLPEQQEEAEAVLVKPVPQAQG